MSTFVDTNVWVYGVDTAEPGKRRVAHDVLRSLASERVVVSSQVLAEFYVVVTRKLDRPLSELDAAEAVRRMSTLEVVPHDAELVNAAIGTATRHQLSLWDSLVVEAAALAGCERLLTEDLQAGLELRGVLVVNPFA